MSNTTEILAAQEKLIQQGSWVRGYDATQVRTPDGITRAFVQAGDTRVWLVQWMATKPPSLVEAYELAFATARWQWRRSK